MKDDREYLLKKLKALTIRISKTVLDYIASLGKTNIESERTNELMALDQIAEEELKRYCRQWASDMPMIAIYESDLTDIYYMPDGLPEESYKKRLIVDPIDGTIAFIHNVDSSWVLAAVAPNKGQVTSLSDIEVAVQTEIPISRMQFGSVIYAIKGNDVRAELWNVTKNSKEREITLQPSRAVTVINGFVTFSKYLLPGMTTISHIEEELFKELFGGKDPLVVFDYQCVSTAGQLYNVMSGRIRFVADIRPLIKQLVAEQGIKMVCAHPYDLCTTLIGEELGIIITDLFGNKLDCPLDTKSDVGYIMYANKSIRREIEPKLLRILDRFRKKLSTT